MRAVALLFLLAACDTAPTVESWATEHLADTSSSAELDARDTSADLEETDAPTDRDSADSLDLRDTRDSSESDTTPDDLADTSPSDAPEGPDAPDTTGAPDTPDTVDTPDTLDAIDTNEPTDTDTSSPPLGTVSDPIAITRFPWVRDLDTRLAESDHLDRYDCSSADESGPELVHRFEVSAAGELVIEVAEGSGVDVDLHLLDRAPPTTPSSAVPCVARANTRLTRQVTPGDYWLVVDTYVSAGAPKSGPFKLAVELTVLDAWQVVELAPGVTWRKKVYANYAGGRQTINVLEVAPSLAGPFLRPYLKRGGGCIRPSRIGAEQGALAAMNAGFFDTGPGTCPPLDLVKADGEVLSYNRLTGAAQRSVGWTEDRETLVAWVDKDRDWPAVVDGLGAYPSLVTAGTIRLEPDRDTDFFDGRHPRTALGVKADGTVLLVVVDGRTAAGVGMTLTALAQHMLNLGAVDAVNLDGGGSTSLWLRDQSINGVVNHPSDNGAADHFGERAVSDILLVFPP